MLILWEISDLRISPNHPKRHQHTPPRLKKQSQYPRFEAPRWAWKAQFWGLETPRRGFSKMPRGTQPKTNMTGWKTHQFERECSSLLKIKILQCHVSFQMCIGVKTSLKTGSGLVWGIFVPPKIDLYIWANALSFKHVNHNPFRKLRCALKHRLVGGFKDFWFSPLPGEDDPIWLYYTFQVGWNHQLVVVGRLDFLSFFRNPGSTSYSGFTSTYGWSEPYSLSGGVVGQEWRESRPFLLYLLLGA